MFHDTKYFSDLSNIFQQDANDKDHCRPSRRNPNGRWIPPDRNWIKINVDTSRRDNLRSTTITFIIKDNDARILMTYDGKIGACPVLIAECEAVRKQL